MSDGEKAQRWSERGSPRRVPRKMAFTVVYKIPWEPHGCVCMSLSLCVCLSVSVSLSLPHTHTQTRIQSFTHPGKEAFKRLTIRRVQPLQSKVVPGRQPWKEQGNGTLRLNKPKLLLFQHPCRCRPPSTSSHHQFPHTLPFAPGSLARLYRCQASVTWYGVRVCVLAAYVWLQSSMKLSTSGNSSGCAK